MENIKDVRHFITEAERQLAVAWLRAKLPAKTLAVIDEHQKERAARFRHGIGAEIRKLLRQQFRWDEQLLDAEWFNLALAAAGRALPKPGQEKPADRLRSRVEIRGFGG